MQIIKRKELCYHHFADSSTKLQKQGSDSFDSSTVSSGDTGINEPSDLHTPSSFNSNLSALSGHLEEALHLDLRDDGQMAAQQIGDSLDDKVSCCTIQVDEALNEQAK